MVSSQPYRESRTMPVAKNEAPPMCSLGIRNSWHISGGHVPHSIQGRLGEQIWSDPQLLTSGGISSCGGLTIYCDYITDGRKNIHSFSLRISYWLNTEVRSIFPLTLKPGREGRVSRALQPRSRQASCFCPRGAEGLWPWYSVSRRDRRGLGWGRAPPVVKSANICLKCQVRRTH